MDTDMATAKTKRQVTVRDFMTGKNIKVECAACYNEEGSYACVRPAHGAFAQKAIVVQKEDAPVEKEVLATAIVSISDAVQKLYKSGLNRRAVVALIADDTKLGKGTIETVLASLLDLRKTYTK
jgi:hypothetical protein